MNETAQDFLTRCFAPGDTIALLLRNASTAKTQQRIVPLERALAPRYRSLRRFKISLAQAFQPDASPHESEVSLCGEV